MAHRAGRARRQGRPTASTAPRPSTSEARLGPLRRHARTKLDVWMSHGDRVEALPPGFASIASTPSAPFAAVEDPRRAASTACSSTPRWSTPPGARICSGTSSSTSAAAPAPGRCAPSLTWPSSRSGPRCRTGTVICALSGGVDSAVAALLVHRAIGDRLPCIFVDNGVLRQRRADRSRRSSARCSTCRSSTWTRRSASSTSSPASPTRSRSARSSATSSSRSSRRR